MAQVLIGTVSGDGSTYEIFAEENGSGGTDFTIKLTAGTGDLLGFFLDYADSNNSLGTNTNVTASYFDTGANDEPPANDIDQVGSNANTMQGTGLLFDAGLQFGAQGQNDIDDVAGVSFTIDGLTFADIDGMTFGIRAQSTPGLEGSVKLVGTFDCPDNPPPPEETCLDGFSHGYWKTHQDTWDQAGEAKYLSGQSYETVFGIAAHGDWYIPGNKGATTNVGADVTLGQALGLQGGGENALAREAVAALENATAGDLIGGTQYAFTEDDIIQAVQFVYGYDDGIAGNEGIYKSALGSQLQQTLEQWNTIHDNPEWTSEEGYCTTTPPGSLFETLGWSLVV